MSSFQTGFFNLAVGTYGFLCLFTSGVCCSAQLQGKKTSMNLSLQRLLFPTWTWLAQLLQIWIQGSSRFRPPSPYHIKAQPLLPFTLSWLHLPNALTQHIHLVSVCHYKARDFFFFLFHFFAFSVFSASEIVTNTGSPQCGLFHEMDKPKGHPLPKMCVCVHMCAWPCVPVRPFGFTANQQISLARLSQGLWGSVPALSSLANTISPDISPLEINLAAFFFPVELVSVSNA